ncbi:bifunctional metallophosphatase/5'-nucleotidase [Cohnella sp. CFH 77786]|uniref:bifunctional metallophosphatase/5'-nucleotidase n=1 Tax=Cohnella sp. CFH 77786 TaxID=2662265 RepID=UPI001C608E72|nr:bifunctional metallophosphatase/5'-nucleotidase [Cohnella sp. CFH 77786]MBW5448031.1 bifunctional metallophosphatase/5'-nucleotidase [Cohnella sp. CFH 77786]
MNQPTETLEIAILQTSDVHGHVFPIHYSDNREMPHGFAKLAAVIRRERKRHPHSILVDNGDLIQGTPLTYHYARVDSSAMNPMIRILNELRYDAAVIGNHEFNYGLDLLNRAVHESEFPWLTANIVNRETGEPFFGKPYRILEFPGGVRAALLGLTTPYIPNWENPHHIEGMEFLDAVEAADAWVKRLKEEERADLVIVSYHGGFERDLKTGEPTETLTGENQGYELCMRVPEIDVLLTGHQHRMLTGEVNGVAVIQPGTQGVRLGKVTLVLQRDEDRWTVREKRAELLPVDEVESDAAIMLLAERYERSTQLWLDQPIGRVEGDMKVANPMEVRLRDHPFTEFINRVQMDVAGVAISNTALFDNFAPGFGPVITMRDVVSNYIYPNTLKVIRVTGQDIRDALERSAAYFADYRGGDGPIEVSPAFMEPKPQHYNYDMWEGIGYTLDISRPAGSRVVRLQVAGEEEALDPAREFDVVMNHYRAGGGGDYPMFKGKPVVREINVDVAELLANYILEKKVIAAEVNRNWEVVWQK